MVLAEVKELKDAVVNLIARERVADITACPTSTNFLQGEKLFGVKIKSPFF